MHRCFVLEPVIQKRAAVAVSRVCLRPARENFITDCPRRKPTQRIFGQGFKSPRVHQNMEKPPLRWLFHVLTICEGGELNAALRNTPVGCFSGDRSILRGSRDIKRLMTSQNARATPLGSTKLRFPEHHYGCQEKTTKSGEHFRLGEGVLRFL